MYWPWGQFGISEYPCIVGNLPLGWSKRVFSSSLNISCNRYRRGWKEVVCESVK